MKIREIIITESGSELLNPDDGFVLYGAVFKGNNNGGLLGSGSAVKAILDAQIDPAAYTNQEFLEALSLPLSVFEEYVEKVKGTIAPVPPQEY